jgi:hypothetical protein
MFEAAGQPHPLCSCVHAGCYTYPAPTGSVMVGTGLSTTRTSCLPYQARPCEDHGQKPDGATCQGAITKHACVRHMTALFPLRLPPQRHCTTPVTCILLPSSRFFEVTVLLSGEVGLLATACLWGSVCKGTSQHAHVRPSNGTPSEHLLSKSLGYPGPLP